VAGEIAGRARGRARGRAQGSGLTGRAQGDGSRVANGCGMSRDHRKLRVFGIADQLVLDVYRSTSEFPPAERYGLQAQIRRAAVSVPANIVEGSARRSAAEYRNFLNIASGSVAEAWYLIDLAGRLNLLTPGDADRLSTSYRSLAGQLEALQQALATRDSPGVPEP
jgi:four helix bundle protein